MSQPALYIYSLGPDPYGSSSVGKWGQYKGRFPDLDQALRGMLIAHAQPTFLTGRREGRFWPGVSIPFHESEVIQVWSNEPAAIAQLDKLNALIEEEEKFHWPHIGDGTTVYLLRELHLSEVAQYQRPVVAGMLMSGDPSDADATPLSPAGRAALSFTPRSRSALQLRLFQAQLGGVKTSVRSSEMLAKLQHQMSLFGEGIRLMNAYCSGPHGILQLHQGDRAPAGEPYSLFQSRVYLAEELGLIANLVDMDHRDMADIDRWLFSDGRWLKFLPLPKCILVTRICREEKQYNGMNGFEAAYHNYYNMESLVWIRDGANVWRFATDVKFTERVFPAADDAPQLVRHIQEHIWSGRWSTSHLEESRRSWLRGRKPETQQPEAEPDPASVESPVPVRFKSETTYDTLEDFLRSEDYTPELDLHIQRRAAEAIRFNQRASMPFALLLQGMIDHRRILNIPAGIDLFDPVQQGRYIRLLADFSHGLPDGQAKAQFEQRTKLDALKPGDRIVARRWQVYTEKYSHVAQWNVGAYDRDWLVFTVHHVDGVAPRTSDPFGNGNVYRIPHKILFVHEYELSKRWVGKSPFTKKLGATHIHAYEWLPADLPLCLAEKLLDDREWKRANRWAVPMLAQWKRVQASIPAPSGDCAPVVLHLDFPDRE